MTNEEKAAILILSLEEENAAAVMRNMMPSEIRRLGKCMSRISCIPGETLDSVAREFCALAAANGGTIAVDVNASKNIMMKALGEKEAGEILSDVQTQRSFENPILEKLRDVDPKVLMDFTRTEHPQTIALILAHLKADQAAEMLESFSPAMQYEIARRMSTLKSVPQDLIEEVARTLETEITVGITGDQQLGGVEVMAEILNKIGRSSESAIMAALEEGDPELAVQLRNLMFTFEDVLKIDDKSLQEVLREVGSEDLARSLKVVDAEMRGKIYKNMSKRGAEILKEDIELMPPVRLSEVEASQRVILEVTKKLEAEGRIVLSRGGGEDEFV